MHTNQENHFLKNKKSHNFPQDCFKYLYLLCPSFIKRIREIILFEEEEETNIKKLLKKLGLVKKPS